MARGFFELNLIQANIGSNIFEAVRTEIAEQPDFAFAIFGFTHGNQINPSVVVVIKGGDTEGTGPVGDGQHNRFEAFSMIVPPERDSDLQGHLRERGVHPTIVIEIEGGERGRNARSRGQGMAAANFPSLGFRRPLGSLYQPVTIQIDGSIVVVVAADTGDGGNFPAKTGRLALVSGKACHFHCCATPD